jgi:hypothetical protein
VWDAIRYDPQYTASPASDQRVAGTASVSRAILAFVGNGAKVAMNYPVAEAPSTVELTA